MELLLKEDVIYRVDLILSLIHMDKPLREETINLFINSIPVIVCEQNTERRKEN